MNWSNKWGEQAVGDGKSQSINIDEGKAANEAMKALGVAELLPIKLGNKTILVTVVGDLGLDFCEPGEKDTGWNIYHLPTLACFSSAVPSSYIHPNDFTYDKPNLLNWMARVQDVADGCYEIGVSNYTGAAIRKAWDELRLLIPDTYLDNGKSAKDIIQKWCLSVKVE